MSETIKESKEKGVFVSEYEPGNKSISINDTLKLVVDVAWLERKWAYNSNPATIINTNGYQLIVHTKNKVNEDYTFTCEDYTFTWTIGTSFKRNFRSCGNNCLMTEFDSLPNIIESWNIQEGRDLYEGATHKIIGELTLYKKLPNE